MSRLLKLPVAALLVVLNGLIALQSPVTQSYSNDVLRLAKAAQIKAYLNEEQDFCDDFYKFACGKWQRVHPATTTQPKTFYLSQLQDLYLRKSADMLNGVESNNALDNTVDLKLRQFAESCRNKSDVLELNMEPILRVVNFRGGWPNITRESWYESEYDWLKVVAKLRRKLGVDIIVGLDVVLDFEDKDMHRIKVGAPKLNLGSKNVYLSNDYKATRLKYKQNIADKLRQYFKYKSEQWALEVAGQVLDLEVQLANGLPENAAELTLKQTSRQRSAAELKSAYGSYVDLSRYLNLIFNQTIYVQVYETPADYMSNLVEVIKQTPKLTLANYTMWRVLETFELAGEFKRNQHTNWCVHQVIEYFPHQLESMFHRNYNNMQMVNELQSVWADIKKTFREELQDSTHLNWITLETRQKSVFKLDAMDLEIVTHHGDNFEEQMQSLVLHKAQYYTNLINILEWQTQHKLVKLIEKPQANDESDDVKLPKYRHATNKIQIPINFLQARFFWDATYPNALKYGTLGFILAHEMIHGFDAIGRKYDKHGYQRNWWDSVSENAFDERVHCLAKQYENHKIPNKSIEGRNTLTTSIADNGGLAVAFRAYQKWWKNVPNNELSKESLPLLKYTQNQIFFIGYAQIWCADYHESMDKFTELPERDRVIGALTNFIEFSDEFECKTGSMMNPTNKCKIY